MSRRRAAFVYDTIFSKYLANNIRYLLYVQEVVNLQKKYFNIFASENEVYTIY